MARGLLDPAPLAALRQQVLEICAGHGAFAPNSPEFLQLQIAAQSLPAFEALRTTPPLRDAVQLLLGGPPLDRQGDVCRVMFPHAPECTTGPHRDQDYLKRPDDVWIAWIPLAACPREQGSVAVVTRPGTRWRHFTPSLHR